MQCVCVCSLLLTIFVRYIFIIFVTKKVPIVFFCVGLLKTIILPADTIPCSDKSFSPLACRSVEFKSCNNEANEKPDQSRKKLPKISTIFFLFLSLTTRIILTVSHLWRWRLLFLLPSISISVFCLCHREKQTYCLLFRFKLSTKMSSTHACHTMCVCVLAVALLPYCCWLLFSIFASERVFLSIGVFRIISYCAFVGKGK